MMDLPVERRKRILELLDGQGSIRTSELARLLGVSTPTVRRDLRALAAQHLVEYSHGGASPRRSGTAQEPPFAVKARLMRAEKERIAEAAARMVAAGSTVILDSGSTTLALARRLAGHRITLIALDVVVAQAAAADPTEVLVVGGRVRNGLYSVVGPWTEDILRGVFADVFFLAADAVDDGGVTNSTVDEAAVKRLAIGVAREVVLVADHTKFGRKALAHVCQLDQLGAVVTDAGIGPYEVVLRERVKQVVIA
jgi:DeoR/GlpR family transcriptional regulator of sugar metabolism